MAKTISAQVISQLVKSLIKIPEPLDDAKSQDYEEHLQSLLNNDALLEALSLELSEYTDATLTNFQNAMNAQFAAQNQQIAGLISIASYTPKLFVGGVEPPVYLAQRGFSVSVGGLLRFVSVKVFAQGFGGFGSGSIEVTLPSNYSLEQNESGGASFYLEVVRVNGLISNEEVPFARAKFKSEYAANITQVDRVLLLREKDDFSPLRPGTDINVYNSAFSFGFRIQGWYPIANLNNL